MTKAQSISILGGGLTGLTTAYRLAKLTAGQRSDVKITVLEKSQRIGGWVNSRKLDVDLPDGTRTEVVLEAGPRSIRPRGGIGAAKMLEMIRDLDLEKSILPISFDHPAAKNRYLLDPSTNQLTRLPSAIKDILTTKSPLLSGLLSSILKEPFKPKLTDPKIRDVSLDSIVRRRLGPNVAENLISAMIHGIYAADTRQLSVRSTLPILWDAEQKRGSIVMGMLRGTKTSEEKVEEQQAWDALGELGKKREKWSLYGLKGGISTLTNKLAQESERLGVEFKTGVGAEESKAAEDGRLQLNSGDSDVVISTLSPSSLSKLLPTLSTLPHLTYNPSTTVGVVNLIFPCPPSQIHPPGFGYLIPRSPAGTNPTGILGVVFDSTSLEGLDSSSAEEKVTKLTVMIGGPHWGRVDVAAWSLPFTRPSEEDLPTIALEHLKTVFPDIPNPVYSKGFLHEECIPTYLVGHGQRMRELHEAVLKSDWNGKLIQTGGGYGGIGVNHCVGMGYDVAEKVANGEKITGLEAWKDWE